MTASAHMPASRRLASALAWRLQAAAGLRATAVWAFAAGAVALGWRLACGEMPGRLPVALALLGLAMGVLVATRRALRRLPSPGSLLAALDERGGAGGLLSAAGDGVALNGWPLPAPARTPAVRWRWQPVGYTCVGALAFLAGAVWLPVPTSTGTALQRLQADETAAALREQLDALADEHLASAEELQAWRDQLQIALASADGKDPVKTWEALDYLGNALDDKASEALQGAQDWSAALAAAETASATLESLAERGAMEPAEQARAVGLVADALRQAAAEAEMALSPELEKALNRALEAASAQELTPEQVRRLQELLRQQREACQLSPERLARLRCLTPEELQALLDAQKACEGGAGDPEALAAALCALPGGTPVSAEGLLAACAEGSPGNGGISRGRGDAALTWSGHTERGAERFREESLSAAGQLDLAQSQVRGVSYAAPTEKTGVVLEGGVLPAAGGTSRARIQIVLPRHRAAVEAYFGRAR